MHIPLFNYLSPSMLAESLLINGTAFLLGKKFVDNVLMTGCIVGMWRVATEFATGSVFPRFGFDLLSWYRVINTKSFHPSVALYLSTVPLGTYSVALRKVFWLKVLLLSVFPVIMNGLSINEITIGRSHPAKAPSPILVTLFGIVTEVSLEHSWNMLSIDIQLLMSYMVKNGLMG